MKRYVEVFWAPYFVPQIDPTQPELALQLLCQEPRPLIQWLYEKRKGAKYLKCPSVIDNVKNCFVIEAPLDIAIRFDKQNDRAETDRYGQKFYDSYIELRNDQTEVQYPVLVTLPPRFVFYANQSVIAQTSDLPIITSEASKHTRLIPGQYDIGQWVRPIDWTMEVIDTEVLNIKRGDPLFMIKFHTKNNAPVKLVRVQATPELIKKVLACTGVKNFIPNVKLKDLYIMAKNYLKARSDK